MNTNNLRLNTDKILSGAMLAVDAVKPGYGPYGVNTILECDDYPYNKVVNDAQTIIQSLKTNDREERLGLNLFKELMDKQDVISGDGRKTAAIIAGTLMQLGRDLDMPKIKLKQELDALIPIIEAKIDQQKRQITVDDVSSVATIAGESKEIGDLLGEIYKHIGKDGIIHLESSGTPKTHFKVTNGVRFMDAPYLAQSLANEEKKAVYENPTILVTKKKISNLGEINPLLRTLVDMEKESLVIFTDDMDNAVAESLIKVNQGGEIKILIIKAPTIWKDYVFEDFAKCVGATIVESGSGLDLKKLPLSALGTCGKIITDSKETILLETKDISAHIKELQEDGSIDSKHRLSWLVTKTCNLYLGANSESDLYYKTMKCKDAINASRLALQDGVVNGAGMCLVMVADAIASSPVSDILRKALIAPNKQLGLNAGLKGFDGYATTDKSVLDAAMVIKNAVRSAIGLASTALTIGVSVPFIEMTKEDIALLNSTKKMF